MPALLSQAVRPVENNANKYGPGLETMRTNGFVIGIFSAHGREVIVSYKSEWIRLQKSTSPSTATNESCQPASNSWVGLMSKRIIAANESALTELCFRPKRREAQKTHPIMAALTVGALDGTMNKKTAIAIIQIIARPGLSRPAVLHSHQMIPIKIPRCRPERLMKCSRPVLWNAR